MKIQVLHNYGGKLTKEQRILPAIYDATDERLFGLADYLVTNGHAIYVDKKLYTNLPTMADGSPIIEPPLPATLGSIHDGIDIEISTNSIPDNVLETPDYESLTLDELRHLLQAYEFTEEDIVSDMSAHWTMRRKELVEWFTKR